MAVRHVSILVFYELATSRTRSRTHQAPSLFPDHFGYAPSIFYPKVSSLVSLDGPQALTIATASTLRNRTARSLPYARVFFSCKPPNQIRRLISLYYTHAAPQEAMREPRPALDRSAALDLVELPDGSRRARRGIPPRNREHRRYPRLHLWCVHQSDLTVSVTTACAETQSR